MKNEELVKEAKKLISETRLWEDLEALCRWERFSGTEGEWEAARYIQNRLEEEGVPTTLHKFNSYLSLPQEASLEVLEPEKLSIPCTTHSFGASTEASGVGGKAVLVSPKGEPTESLDGKVALIDGMVSPDMFYKLESTGAIAQVYANIGEIIHDLTVSSVWGTPSPQTADRLPRTPVATIARSAAAPLVEALRDGRKVSLRLRAIVDTRWRPVEMPEAVVRASGEPTGKDGSKEFVLISAHLDSWYMGAMDNGTGDVLLMEVARTVHRLRENLRRDLRLVFWIGHSHGRYSGSSWYVDRFWDLLKEGCVAHLNVDQAGFRDGRVFRLLATADIAQWAHQTLQSETAQDASPKPPGRNADQSFWGLGVPSFSLRASLVPESDDWPPHKPPNGLPWYWHHRDDTLDKIDRKLMAEHTRVHAAAVVDLLNRPILPLNPAALGEKILSELKNLSVEAGGDFDLGQSTEAATRFVSAANNLMKEIGDSGELDADRTRLVNRSLRQLSQKLICVLFTAGGPYEQDPATSQPLLPGLDPARGLSGADEPEFLIVQLFRERNRLVDTLEEAREITETALSQMA